MSVIVCGLLVDTGNLWRMSFFYFGHCRSNFQESVFESFAYKYIYSVLQEECFMLLQLVILFNCLTYTLSMNHVEDSAQKELFCHVMCNINYRRHNTHTDISVQLSNTDQLSIHQYILINTVSLMHYTDTVKNK